MRLELRRVECGATCTIGWLYVDGVLECFTLEDTVRARGVKVPGETAIPPGVYPVSITYSPRFGVDLPLLTGVDNFVGIRIHPGNTAADTEGCLLVGQTRGVNSIGNSRAAFQKLMPKLLAAKARGEAITIKVS